MARRRETTATPTRLPYAFAAGIVLCAGVIAIPVTVPVNTWEPMRLPKEILFRAEAILLMVVAVFAMTNRSFRWRQLTSHLQPVEWWICGGVTAWSGLTTLTSTNRLLSLDSLVTVVASVVIYAATRVIAPRLPFAVIGVLLVPALANAILAILQEYGIWNPFEFPPGMEGHAMTTGFLGNANDVGAFLVLPAFAAIVAFGVSRGLPRWLYGLATVVLVVGLVASATRTAFIAFAAGAVAITFSLGNRRQLVAASLALAAVLASLVVVSTSLRENFRRLAAAVSSRDYHVLLSGRVVPFLAALDMAADHPLTGAGPGTFKYHFMATRFELEKKYPEPLLRWVPQNYGEVHSDHLQVAAEAGAVGYALFLAAIAGVAAARFGIAPGNPLERARFARALAVPLAVSFFVLALAQFPLQIAAPRIVALSLAGLVRGWATLDD